MDGSPPTDENNGATDSSFNKVSASMGEEENYSRDDHEDDDREEEDDSLKDENQEMTKGKHYNFFEREAMRMARNPCMYFWIAFLSSLVVGVAGMIFGDFSVSADNEGWNSRGTSIADRETQLHMTIEFGSELFSDTTDDVWLDLINNVQPGWESDDDDRRRSLLEQHSLQMTDRLSLDDIGSWGHRLKQGLQMQPMKALEDAHAYGTTDNKSRRSSLVPVLAEEQIRLLTVLNSTEGTLLEGCDTSWYTSQALYDDTHLWPIWRARSSTTSFFDADLLEELCLEEQETQSFLEERRLCLTCQDGSKCLQPYSTVFYARLTVNGGMSMSCQELATAWKDAGQEEAHKTSLQECVADLETNYNVALDGLNMPESCPNGFYPTILDEFYSTTERAEYSSTIFATPEGSEEDLYDNVGEFSQGREQIKGVYDTQDEDFVGLSLDEQLLIDMSLAVGSAFVTCIAIVVHTRSPFLMVSWSFILCLVTLGNCLRSRQTCLTSCSRC